MHPKLTPFEWMLVKGTDRRKVLYEPLYDAMCEQGYKAKFKYSLN
jgi:hypothetical protein